MVTFTKDSFVVEVKTGHGPVENYLETANDIINVLQNQEEDLLQKNYYLLELLRQMLPDYEQAKAMFDEIKDL